MGPIVSGDCAGNDAYADRDLNCHRNYGNKRKPDYRSNQKEYAFTYSFLAYRNDP
jgi:hypothetical protein